MRAATRRQTWRRRLSKPFHRRPSRGAQAWSNATQSASRTTTPDADAADQPLIAFSTSAARRVVSSDESDRTLARSAWSAFSFALETLSASVIATAAR